MPESEVKQELRRLINASTSDKESANCLMYAVDAMSEEEAKQELGRFQELEKLKSDFDQFAKKMRAHAEAFKLQLAAMDESAKRLDQSVARLVNSCDVLLAHLSQLKE